MKKSLVFLLIIFSMVFFFSIDPTFADEPIVLDDDYKIEIVAKGLSMPSSIIFADNQMFVNELSSGKIIKVLDNGIIQINPVLELSVAPYTDTCAGCGLLGTANLEDDFYVFHTTNPEDMKDRKNIIIKYRYDGVSFVEPIIMKELQGGQIDHNGGAMAVGINNDVYFTIGDQNQVSEYVNFPVNEKQPFDSTKLQQIVAGAEYGLTDLDDHAGIFKIHDGKIERFAMGIRNSFGLAVDPKTGFLWETENGPMLYDEINLVKEKFNGGWMVLNGPSTRSDTHVMAKLIPEITTNYKNYKYSDPEFSWYQQVSPTAIEFPNSSSFEKYSDYVFVGTFNTGTIHNFQLNTDRTGFIFKDQSLKDLVYDEGDNDEEIIFAKGFSGGISDIVFANGGMYVLSIFDGKVYKISPKNIPTPLEQYNDGVFHDSIMCKQKYIPIMKKSGSIACVTPKTGLFLYEHGWIFDHPYMPTINLRNKALDGFSFNDINLSGSDSREIDFQNIEISNVDFSTANLAHTNLSGKDMTGILLIESNLSGADLSNADLSNVDLSGTNLSGADLSGADLSGADLKEFVETFGFSELTILSGANLSDMDLSGIDLRGINLNGVDLSSADLSGANLSGAHLSEANLYQANLNRADLTRADLTRADLREADLTRANLTEVELSETNLSGADLREADFIDVDLSNTILTGANLSYMDLSGIDLRGINLSGIDLRGINLDEADLREATLIGTNLSGATFNGTNLRGADLSYANLRGIDLRDTELSDVDFSNANLAQTNLSGKDLTVVIFIGVNLNSANLSGVDLSHMHLNGAYLIKANLSDAIITGADLSNVNLSGAILTGANLENVVLTDAKLNCIGHPICK